MNIGIPGSWQPFSGTFQSSGEVDSYQLRSLSVKFPEEALSAADASADPTYYQLPEGMSERIGSLASDITSRLQSPYGKARAIEAHLRRNYTYLDLEGNQEVAGTPGGVDPVEWFLFDHREGGSSAFSSAFVLLARASGVPARVVSGWRIQPVTGRQSINGTHARQWAEIALEGLGWVAFDPTPGKDYSPSISRAPDRDPALPGSVTSDRSEDNEPGTTGATAIPEQTGEDISALIGMALHRLASSEDPLVRSDAALSLGGFGGESVFAALAEAALNDPNGVVR